MATSCLVGTSLWALTGSGVFNDLEASTSSYASLGALSWLGSATGHVEDIKFVINFDFPNCSEDYVHRIGRTGRSTNTGTAYTFFTQRNSKQATDLVNVLREAKQVISPKLLQLEEGSSRGGGRWRGGRGGNRFSGGGSRFSGGSSYNSRSTNSYGGGGGGFKSNSYSSSQNSYSNGGFKAQTGGFKAQNGFSSSNSNSYGSSQSKPFQNGSSGGFQAQWGQGGVTATSLSAVPPPSTF